MDFSNRNFERTATVLLVLVVVAAGNLPGTRVVAPVNACNGCNFLLAWGSYGTGNGQFNNAFGVAVDKSGDVYVSDSYSQRVEKFTSTGAYLTQWGCTTVNPAPPACAGGTGKGQFSEPFGIAFDSSGNWYVAEAGNNRVQKFSSTGMYVTQLGCSTVNPSAPACTASTGNGQLDGPYGVAVDSLSGSVYVADTYNNRVEKFTGTGAYLTQWGCTTVNPAPPACTDYNSGPGQFYRPTGIAVDSSGNVYVVDEGNNRVEKFKSDGTYVTQYGSGGSGPGQFNRPMGIAFDSAGNWYVAEINNNRVQKFNSAGTYVTAWGCANAGNGCGAGSALGQFNSPIFLAVDPSGDVYVADRYNYRIESFGDSPLISVTAPANNTPVSAAYVPISVQIVTVPTSLEKDAQISVFVNSTNPACPVTNASNTGLYSCGYQVEAAGKYEVNVTATITSRLGNFSISSENYYFTAGPIVTKIPLVQGWNLISTPIIPARTSIGTVLASQVAGGNFTVIWSYQGGKWLSAMLSGGKLTGTLTTIQDGYGYWVYMTKQDYLFVVGSDFAVPPATPPSYSLSVGWNLIGFTPEPTIASEPTSSYLSSLNGNYGRVYLYDNTSGTWTENPSSLEPGQAIWVYVTASTILTP